MNVYINWLGKSLGKRPLGEQKKRWENKKSYVRMNE
jgi:hypothetical protein